jgi:UDP-2,3-diacylglucosamine pyrophosphatase LpxH
MGSMRPTLSATLVIGGRALTLNVRTRPARDKPARAGPARGRALSRQPAIFVILSGVMGALPSGLAARLPPAGVLASLASLAERAPTRTLGRGERVVVFSDLHMGGGGRRDDFLPNGELLAAALRRYYLPRRFTLVLNGDVEELQRFHLPQVRRQWAGFYALLEEFARRGRLERLVGNHDAELAVLRDCYPAPRLLESLRLVRGRESLLLLHGHQASYLQTRFLGLATVLLRYVANPLGIHNWSVSRSSRRRFRVERRVYAFARGRRQVVLIGHTHRPLFESLSKLDTLRFRIEDLCRRIPSAALRRRPALERELAQRKQELERVLARRGRDPGGSLYDWPLLVPCLFNSGCCIGKRGLTGLEIAEGSIALVHWFDPSRSRHSGRAVPGTLYRREVLEREPLDYLFTRVRLLS